MMAQWMCNSISAVKFWCELFDGDEYKELASLGLLLLSISPTSVICERGFSVMNYVKNQYRSVLTHACMVISMTNQTVTNFPFFVITTLL